MDEVRLSTLVALGLSILSLLLVFVDWRASVLLAVLAILAALHNLKRGEW